MPENTYITTCVPLPEAEHVRTLPPRALGVVLGAIVAIARYEWLVYRRAAS